MKLHYIKNCLACAFFLLLLIDIDPALAGMRVGIETCLKSAIPSLLPFLIITKFLTGQLYGLTIPVLSKLGEWCGIPSTMESVLGIGLVGGYPVGAQLITDAWKKGLLNKQTAERMLGFCNNAGPAFIFGVCATLFTSTRISWYIMIIQILSSLCCGFFLPGKSKERGGKIQRKPVSFIEHFETALVSMGRICGWILCFRVVISYIEAYFFIGNSIVQACIFGFLELMNGCIALCEIPSELIRFIAVNGMLSFGGLCVWMQSAGAAKGLSLKWFYTGKILQSLLSISFAAVFGKFLFRSEDTLLLPSVLVLASLIIAGSLCWKKVVAFLRVLLYNNQKKRKKRYQYAVPQKN